jgi:hypothetical protein
MEILTKIVFEIAKEMVNFGQDLNVLCRVWRQ